MIKQKMVLLVLYQVTTLSAKSTINPIKDRTFRGCSPWGGEVKDWGNTFPKTRYIYPIMMKHRKVIL